MTETQKRIEAYQKALPDIKEKVVAVAMLLALSVIMLTSASFAWLTISRAPEVTAVSTNVAANGNLEIALATGDGTKEPGESKVGDSSASQNVTLANLTWGNLINLNDPSYGLDSLVLRPAQLNTVALGTNPLIAAEFLEDGRVSQLLDNFAYTNWVEKTEDREGHFAVLNESKLGVRAISSTKPDAEGAELKYTQLLNKVTSKNYAAGSMYTSMTSNTAYMNSLTTLMGKYMTDRMDNDGTYKNPDVPVSDIRNIIKMYEEFLLAFDAEAEALAELANLQLYIKNGESSDGTLNYIPLTKDDIYAAGTSEKLKSTYGVVISDLKTFIDDRATIANDIELLKNKISEKNDADSVKWNDISSIVNNLVDVGECEMHDGRKIKNIGATAAMDYLNADNVAIITNGILYNFELRTGEYIYAEDLVIKVSVKRSVINYKDKEVVSDVRTSAKNAGYTLFNNDLQATKKMSVDKGIQSANLVANDTYGLVIDLWVKTNAVGSYLTLEGNLLTEETVVDAKGKDPNGKEVQLYTVTKNGTDNEGNQISDSYDVYKGKTTVYDEEGNATEVDAWFRADTHMLVTEEDLGGVEPKWKKDTIITVVGYEGENRVWDKDSNKGLSLDATTQGSGSCYVYYAGTPEDQERSLKLLEAFKVAFVNADGKLLAEAEMDTEHFFAENGRVTVPLVLSIGSGINIGVDVDTNKEIYAITDLEKNVSTRITAIVYLDGKKLANEDVLAASEIQGKLNIQFGSSEILEPINDDKLKSEELKVSAELTGTSFDYDTATEPMITNIKVKVTGYEPNEVKASFIRAISSTQGIREEEMTFQKNSEGDWVEDYIFTTPGNYILRSVELDGVEYDLEVPQTVTVEGFVISNLTCAGADLSNTVKIMTAENSYTADLSLQFRTNDPNKMPKKVVGVYTYEETGSATNVNFTLGSNGTWTGKATFYNSGTYTLEYFILDGEYTGLDASLWQTAEVNLGMYVAVYTTQNPTEFKYEPGKEDFPRTLGMKVMIYDNADTEMPGLANVELIYSEKSSKDRIMDANLVWNGSYYVGDLVTYVGQGEDANGKHSGGIGIWEFGKVKVGDNNISASTEAPVFKIKSTEPPEYNKHNTVSYQYAPNKDATMNVWLKNAQTATVQATIVNTKNNKSYDVDIREPDGRAEMENNIHKFIFEVPKDENGNQDGYWQLTTIRIWDAYAADGTPYTKEEPLVFDVSGENNVTTAVNRIIVDFAEGQSKHFGRKDYAENGEITAEFMTSHKISGLNVDIEDFDGNPIPGIDNVKLTFTYQNGTSSTNGGYSSDDFSNYTEGAEIVVDLVADESGTHFAQEEDKTILYAGNYVTTFSYELNGVEKGFSKNNLPAGTPEFTVWSKTPMVAITEIGPEGTFAYDNTTNGTVDDEYAFEKRSSGWFPDYRHYWITNSSHKTGAKPTLTSTTATVYFECDHTNESKYGYGEWRNYKDYLGTTSTKDYHQYVPPYVTITLSNMGGASGASLSFGTDAHVYENAGETTKTNYSWTKDGPYAVKRYIGLWTDSSSGNDGKTVAGTIEATELILYYDINGDGTAEEFKVLISTMYPSVATKITINNKY